MLDQSHWYQGNPHYAALWKVATPQQRLQRDVFEAFLNALPEASAKALVYELLAAEHPTELRAVCVDRLVQPVIDLVIKAAQQRSVSYVMHGEEVHLIPLNALNALTSQPKINLSMLIPDDGTSQEDSSD